ncbi:ABC transporter ATP-binding protein [uncultured Devosia sp.]|uniref:ABC transporter ATP-binding protein n=1 Tax=uncultured Devosia sp. TaxID=211434 RepID=UPI0035C9F27A
MSGLALSATALTLRYDDQLVLDTPPLAAAPGSLTVLSGASGSGKSSLLYLLSGLARPTSGSLAWGETELSALSEAGRDRWRRRHAGFIFQDFHLIDEMTPLDNVLLPAWFGAWNAAPRRKRAETLLAELAVPLERRQAGLLSRGEQQRVAIARALLADPAIIFADEPTASLDQLAGAHVIAVLSRLAAEGRTVIAASHDPDLRAAATAELVLDHGRVNA